MEFKFFVSPGFIAYTAGAIAILAALARIAYYMVRNAEENDRADVINAKLRRSKGHRY